VVFIAENPTSSGNFGECHTFRPPSEGLQTVTVLERRLQKDDRTHRDANVKQMDSNEQKLDKTNEKLADQKQDAATK
jgi:hypothetical protein